MLMMSCSTKPSAHLSSESICDDEWRRGRHSRQLLGELHSLWDRKELCDVRLCVDGAVYDAHKLVLSAASAYFQGMFLGNMRENWQQEVEIHGISKEIFSLLLEFIYTGCVPVHGENCQELLAAADMMGLSALLEQCCDFLVEQLDSSNALGIMQFAECHGCSSVKKEAIAFVHKHFLEVTTEEEYFDLPEEHVISLLQSEYLQVDNEFQVFTAALQWVLHDIKSRRKSVFAVCAPVRFPIISYKQLESYVAECEDLSLKIALHKLISDYKTTPTAGTQNLRHQLKLKLKPFVFQPRKFARKCIYVTGGYSRQAGQRWCDSVSLADVHCFSSFDQAWTTEAHMQQPRSGHGACLLNGRIYVVGGECESLIFDSAEALDPSDGSWSAVASLKVPRCGLGVCALGGAIYALGGWIGPQIGATVEKYYPDDDCWREWDKMQTPRFVMGMVEYEGLIYLAGGTSDMGTEMDLLESYNPITKEWLSLPCMYTKRAFVGLGVIDNMLYAVGGWNEDTGALSSVERYDIDKMKWDMVPPMSVSRAGAGVASINGYLYVMGGRTSLTTEVSSMTSPPATLASVECYNPQTEMWLNVGDMPASRCEGAVAVL